MRRTDDHAVTRMVIDRFDAPSSSRAARAMDSARAHAADELAGRTVWCTAALPGGRATARALREMLQRADEPTLTADNLDLDAGDRLQELGGQLELMLRGERLGSPALGAAER